MPRHLDAMRMSVNPLTLTIFGELSSRNISCNFRGSDEKFDKFDTLFEIWATFPSQNTLS